MPLVRIDLRKGKDAAYRQEIGRVVYEALIGVGVPKNDRFQVIGQFGQACWIDPGPEAHRTRFDRERFAFRVRSRGLQPVANRVVEHLFKALPGLMGNLFEEPFNIRIQSHRGSHCTL